MTPAITVNIAAAAAVCVFASSARALDDGSAARAIRVADQQLAATAAALTATSVSPTSTRADGTWETASSTNPVAWTQGFFPGANWYVFELTGDPAAKSRAEQWTRALEAQKLNRQTHDLGFKMYPSFGHAYRVTGDPYYKSVLQTAAGSLASRFDPALGAVICCDWNPDWQRPTVIDTLMNLELLLWAARNGGQQAWRDMAVSHALKTLADMVRADGSTYHVVDYSTAGAIRFRGTFQGYSDSSTWTRGQAWAIYGFTMVYRYTGDSRMLAAARKVTDFYLARLGNESVPSWDFDAPTQQKDSSAAAAVASALFELSGFVGAADRDRYSRAATRMLDELASPAYLATETKTAAILLHGVGHLPAGKAVDAGLTYGDYYFIEALARRPTGEDAGVPDAGPGGSSSDAGVPDAGTSDGGPPAGSVAVPPDRPSASAGGCTSSGDAALGAFAVLAFLMIRRRVRAAALTMR
jgi:unsaturated chondroitin disaccharide hydrolase